MYLQIKRAIMASLLSIFCFVAYAQQAVTGTVKDATGEPMIGVTVLLNGQAAAVTDIDGNFTIKAEPKDVVKVSYIGYTDQEITVGNKTSLDIVLQEDSQTLNEVVVVGYGTMKKSDLTGSISSVDTEKLNAKGAASVMGNLQGANPGVNITQTSGRAGGDFNIEIRGKSSINGDTKPLYVVDGVMCDDINFLNPQDIERIDVLKDASSTAIYGSRATAGVVMVTTKSGAGVSKEQKPTISYDGYWGFTKTTRTPDFQKARDFYNYRFLKFLERTDADAGAQPSYYPANLGQCLLQAVQNDVTSPYRLKELLAAGVDNNWPDLVTRTGQQQNHYLAVNGGSEKINYHFGVGYNQEKGIYKHDEQNRINFKGSLDARLNNIVSAGFSVNAARTEKSMADDNAIDKSYYMNPFLSPRDADGNIIYQPGQKEALNTDNNNFTSSRNPLNLIEDSKKERTTWRLLGNFYLKFDLMKGLDFKTTFSPNYTSYREGYFKGYINPRNGLFYDDENHTENSAYTRNQTGFSWTWDNIVNYNTTIAEDHSLGLMGLYSVQASKTEDNRWYATAVNEGTDWWNLASGVFNADDSKNSYTENSMISWAFRANYSWKQRYLLTATARWDGSSKFASGHRWGFFPSVAVAWRITEEEFMQKLPWISNMKLRLSYGVTGNNSGVGNYATIAQAGAVGKYPFGTTYYDGYGLAAYTTSELMWEKSHEVNFGIDYGFLNNRINGTIDIYQKTSTDLLYGVTLPYVTGYNNELYTNVGSVRNRGIEISLSTVNIQTKDWHWTTTLNFAHNKNEVREINGISNRIINGETTSLFVGESVNNIFGYEWGGIVTDRNMVVPDHQIAKDKGFTPGETVRACDYYYACYGIREGQPYVLDKDGDGQITDVDKTIYNRDPKWTGSFTSNLSYKNIDFSFSLYAKVGQYVSSSFISEYTRLDDRGRVKLNENWYIPAGTMIDCDGVNADGTYINPVYQQQTHYGSYPFPNYGIGGDENSGVGPHATYWNTAKTYVKASYLKVQNITLGYTFPKKWINKIGCNHLRVYCTVTNPFVFTKYKGFDPEWADANRKNDGPSTITCQFGASIKF